MTTTTSPADLVKKLDRTYGHSPYYLIGQIEFYARKDLCGKNYTPTQRLAHIARAIEAWEKTRTRRDGS
ncbi:MAG: hypothetical protein GEV10_09725 [Streptosporangiales bacterium]|nr:hypothetical protein [Streptosporangiales bacterium]